MRKSLVFLVFLAAVATHAAEPVTYDGLEKRPIGAIVPAGDGWFMALVGSDCPLMTVDRTGNVRWANRYGTAEPHFAAAAGDALYAGGRLIEGRQDRWGAFLIRLSGGSPEWARAFSADGSLDIDAGDAGANGVVFTGDIDGVAIVIAIDPSSKLRWAKTYPGAQTHAIRAVGGGGSIVAGRIGKLPWLARLDASGDVVWQRAGSAEGSASTVTPTRDGGFVVAGRGGCACGSTGKRGLWIMKVDGAGKMLWQKLARGDYKTDHIIDVIETSDGGLARAATSASFGDGLLIMKLAASGRIVWQKLLPGQAWAIPFPTRVLQPAGDGGFVLATSIATPAPALITIDANGETGNCALLLDAHVIYEDVKDEEAPDQVAAAAQDIEVTSEEMQYRMGPLNGHARPFCTAAKSAPAEPSSQLNARFAAFERLESEREAYSARIRKLFTERQWSAIDAELASARRDVATIGGPLRPKIELAFDAIGEVANGRRLAEEWVAAAKDPSSAHVALAVLLIAEDKEDKARKALDAVPAQDRDPYWYATAIAAAAGDNVTIRQIARSACGKPPLARVWSTAVNYVQPKWGGTYEDALAVTEEGARCTRAYGDQVYAYIAYIAARDDMSNYTRYGFSWPRVRKGYEQMIAASPDWLGSHHSLAYLAFVNGDHAFAADMFGRPELGWTSRLGRFWHGGKETYDSARIWATNPEEVPTGAPPAPMIAAPPRPTVTRVEGKLTFNPSEVHVAPPPKIGQRVWIAGPDSMIEASLIGTAGNAAIFVQPAGSFDVKQWIGAPVLDAKGNVVALVTGMGMIGPTSAVQASTTSP